MSKFHVVKIKSPGYRKILTYKVGSGNPSNIIDEVRLCHKKSEKSRPIQKPAKKGINLN